MANYMAVFINAENGEIDGVFKAEAEDLKDQIKKIKLEPPDDECEAQTFSNVKRVNSFSTLYTESSPGCIWIFLNNRWICIKV